MKSINIALIQYDISWENPKENFTKLNQLFLNIKKDVELVILPEMFATGFTMNINELDQSVGDSIFTWLQKKAKEINKIIIGSILIEEKKKYYNRMFWMRPDGSFEQYDKRHLFQMGDEHKVMTAGKRRVIVPYKNIRFMLQICYDLRFPVWVKNKYNKESDSHDYDAIIYIANWPEVRKHAYLSLLKARAIENQAYVIWVNRTGVDAKGVNHTGDSQLIDPLGFVINQTKENSTEICYTQIDPSKLKEIRAGFKVGLDWDLSN
jgi:predicted amidohydrolase